MACEKRLCSLYIGKFYGNCEDFIANFYHKFDLPSLSGIDGDIAIDTEAMGLNNFRDRLCAVQISCGNGDAHVVHFPEPKFACPNLKALLADPSRTKIFHFARFDLAIIKHYLGLELTKVYCTKVASRLVRTYTDLHGLKDLCDELLKIKISKHQQSSDWGAGHMTPEQLTYAASDVLHLHALRGKLNAMLNREGRMAMAQSCFDFLPVRANLDLLGWSEFDIFQH